MVTTAAEGGVVPTSFIATSFIGGTCRGHPGHVALGMLSGASCGLLRLLGCLAYITGYGRLLAAYPSSVSNNPPLRLNLHATHDTIFFDYQLFSSLLSLQRYSHSRVGRAG